MLERAILIEDFEFWFGEILKRVRFAVVCALSIDARVLPSGRTGNA